MNKDGRFRGVGRKKRTSQDEAGKITAAMGEGNSKARKIREKRDFVAWTTETRQELSTSPSRASISRWGRLWMEWIPANRRTQDFRGWLERCYPLPRGRKFCAVSIIPPCRVKEPDDDSGKKRPNIFVCSKWIPLRKRRTSGDVEISCEESLRGLARQREDVVS